MDLFLIYNLSQDWVDLLGSEMYRNKLKTDLNYVPELQYKKFWNWIFVILFILKMWIYVRKCILKNNYLCTVYL